MRKDDYRRIWSGWANGRLILQVCNNCETARFYPTAACSVCSSRSFDWRVASGSGVIHAVTHVPPPNNTVTSGVTVALVELHEAVRVLAVVDDNAEIGTAVRIAPTGEERGPLRFQPA